MSKCRAELSRKNKYWIEKHRYYELKHFCLQYQYWKRSYAELECLGMSLSRLDYRSTTNIPSDLTSKYAIMKSHYSYCIDIVEQTAYNADNDLCEYILKAVTENLSYSYLKARLNIPCSRDLYYDRYRRFFWLLDSVRK